LCVVWSCVFQLSVEGVDRKPSITVTLSSAGEGGEEDEVVDEELLVNDTWMILDDARGEQVGKLE
jgi:hypothetical protein